MLYYITGNKDKITNATRILKPLGIVFEQKNIPLFECQTDSLEEIATHKAKQAYQVLKNPLFVNDAGWYITALKGFPGPYMKYVNQWFSPQDFLDLMQHHDNREVSIREAVCYVDDTLIKVFTHEIKGIVLRESKGKGLPNDCVMSFSKDRKSIAECKNEGIQFINRNETLWEEFASWYKTFNQGEHHHSM